MNVVLDTHVLVSGLLNPAGAPGRIIDLIQAGVVLPVVDDRIVAEYRDVLSRPSRYKLMTGEDVDSVMDYLECIAVRVSAVPLKVRLPDPDDEPFLEVAQAAGCPLVTGNARHFPPRATGLVAVLSPRAFVDRVAMR